MPDNTRPRGRLKVYLGAAPGVGKTYAMLTEAHDLLKHGKDVAIGIVETHQRPATRALTEGLPAIPLKIVRYRQGRHREVNVPAIIARAPDVVLVDELAHTIVHPDQPASADHAGASPGAAGLRHKRYEDVQAILDAGIDVITTVNIQHVESLRDVVYDITGVKQKETVPDWVLRGADDVELVDLGPDALRKRLADGLIYRPEQVDAALSRYFRLGNITALRELALLWLADKVDEGLATYRRSAHVDQPLPARECVLVAVDGSDASERLLRRGARIAGKASGRSLHAVYVISATGLRGIDQARLNELRDLTHSLSGHWHAISGTDSAATIVETARRVNATQIVVGTSRSLLKERLVGPGLGRLVAAKSGTITVCLVPDTHKGSRLHLPRQPRHAMTTTRRILACVLAACWLAATTAGGHALGEVASEISIVPMLYVAGVVMVALVGGLWPALAAGVAAVALENWFFTEPLYTLRVGEWSTIAALGVFSAVALAVALVVDRAAEKTEAARRAERHALVLSELAGTVIREGTNVEALIAQMSAMFRQTSVSVVERDERDGGQRVLARIGPECGSAQEADTIVDLDATRQLWMIGHPLSAPEARILDAYAGRIVRMLDRRALEKARVGQQKLQAANAVRTALLNAVSHDLRTPLASIKASVSSLRMSDVELPEQMRAELLAGVEESTDKLETIIGQLVDMGGIHNGELEVTKRLTDVGDVVAHTLRRLSPQSRPAKLAVDLPPDLPLVATEPGLLERVLANLIDNAAKYGGGRCLIDAAAHDHDVIVRVVDYGPGLDETQKDRMYVPFQRFGDRRKTSGLGLGLAVASGLATACGASLEAHDTPGGGLTMAVTLPIAAPGLDAREGE
ncbi:MAG: DUF4118 domain-containing protein [Actinomycetaceae bacterium]|nr:DUF4118 domain-containing protein [Actinomycetaceae bacterium]